MSTIFEIQLKLLFWRLIRKVCSLWKKIYKYKWNILPYEILMLTKIICMRDLKWSWYYYKNVNIFNCKIPKISQISHLEIFASRIWFSYWKTRTDILIILIWINISGNFMYLRVKNIELCKKDEFYNHRKKIDSLTINFHKRITKQSGIALTLLFLP